MDRLWQCIGVLIMILAITLKLFSHTPTVELIWTYLVGLSLVIVWEKRN